MTLPAPWPNAPITTLPGQIPGTPITTLPGQVPPESTFPIPTETACGIPGQRVTAAQKALNERYGFNLPVNGFYDCTTRTGVVMALQRVLNEQFGTALRADGNLTPETIAAIPSFPPNSPENLVYLLQIMLMLNAYDVGKIDGIYGPATRSAVQVFQKDYFIQPNGIAEPDMILKLLEC
ncbi:MAG: peptidoglycan-binding protein [Oscillospiraceae bacterium]|nr:peptidoglycan-binding protein [Oscillospiraceae bacterium]